MCSAYFRTEKLRFSSRSCGSTLRILRLFSKVAIFQPEVQEHAPRTTFVLKSCDFQAGAAADQGGIEPATAGLRKQARKPRDNFQRPFREQQNRTAPQRDRFDTHDLRRGYAETKKNSHGAKARALRHARSPQRVHPKNVKNEKKTRVFCTSGTAKKRQKRRLFCTSTTRIPAEGRAGTAKTRQKPRLFCASTTPVSAEGRAVISKNKTNRLFAPRPRRSPQSVARAHQKTPKKTSFGTSTTPISAEGRAGISKNVKNLRVFAPRPRRSPQRVAFPIVGNIPTPRQGRDSEYRALSLSFPRVKYLI